MTTNALQRPRYGRLFLIQDNADIDINNGDIISQLSLAPSRRQSCLCQRVFGQVP